jgi:hypothetical protein
MDEQHSGMGIASFVISLVMGVIVFVLIVVAGVAEASTPDGLSENSPVAVLLGLLIIGCLVVSAVGLDLGIAALAQRGRKHVLSVLGTTFNGVIIVGTLLLVVIGSFTE